MTQPFFRSPAFDEPETCTYCGCAIRPGELICEVRDDPFEYLHESCWDVMREEGEEANADAA